jgi:chromate reductase
VTDPDRPSGAGVSAERPVRILAIAGSLRRGSYNQGVLRAAIELAPSDVVIVTFDIGTLPPHNEDLRDGGDPEPVAALKEAIAAADAVLFVTPEHNRSIPGVLKNAIDWASRPVESTPLNNKPVGLIGASDGPWGTTRAQMHLRQILTGTNSLAMVRPEVYIGLVPQFADDDGNLVDEKQRNRVRDYVIALADWARRVGPTPRP